MSILLAYCFEEWLAFYVKGLLLTERLLFVDHGMVDWIGKKPDGVETIDGPWTVDIDEVVVTSAMEDVEVGAFVVVVVVVSEVM